MYIIILYKNALLQFLKKIIYIHLIFYFNIYSFDILFLFFVLFLK